MRRLLMSRLIRIFTVCLVNLFLFQYLKYETNKVAVRVYLSVRIYPTLSYMPKENPCTHTLFCICYKTKMHFALYHVHLLERNQIFCSVYCTYWKATIHLHTIHTEEKPYNTCTFLEKKYTDREIQLALHQLFTANLMNHYSK